MKNCSKPHLTSHQSPTLPATNTSTSTRLRRRAQSRREWSTWCHGSPCSCRTRSVSHRDLNLDVMSESFMLIILSCALFHSTDLKVISTKSVFTDSHARLNNWCFPDNYCTSNVIASNWVLTPCHCVLDLRTKDFQVSGLYIWKKIYLLFPSQNSFFKLVIADISMRKFGHYV